MKETKWRSLVLKAAFCLSASCFVFLQTEPVKAATSVSQIQKEEVFYPGQEDATYHNEETAVVKKDEYVSYMNENYLYEGTYDNVKKLILEEGVTTLNVGLLSQFRNLEELELPSTLRYIGGYHEPKDRNQKLKKITLAPANEKFTVIDDVLYSKYTNSERMAAEIYPAAKQDSTYVVPENVYLSGWDAGFTKNPYVTKIVIGKNDGENYFFTYFVKKAFPNLKEIEITEENTKYSSKNGVIFDKSGKTLVAYLGIGETAYTVPKGTVTIASDAFSNATLTSLTLPEGVTTLKSSFLDESKIASLSLPASTKTISSGAFMGAGNLKTITVSAKNTAYTAYQGVLYNKAKTKMIHWPAKKIVTKLVLPSTLKSLKYSSIPCQKNITSFVIPKAMTDLNSTRYNRLKTVSIEKGNKAYVVKDNAVYKKDYSELILYPIKSAKTKVVLAEGLQKLYLNVFGYEENNITEIILPKSLKKVTSGYFSGDRIADGFTKLTTIKVKSGNKYYKTVNGILYNKAMTSLHWFPMNKKITTYTLPSTVKQIRNTALSRQNYIQVINIPGTCESFDQQIPMDGCDYEFYLGSACPKLKAVNIKSSSKKYSSTNGVVYNKEKTSILLYPQGKTDTSFTMPASCRWFDWNGANRYLKKLVLSKTINFPSIDEMSENYINWNSMLSGYSALQEIQVSSANENIQSIDGAIYTKGTDDIELLLYPIASPNKTYTVPEGLKTIKIPDSLLHAKNRTGIQVSENNSNYYVKDNVLYTRNGTEVFR